MYLRNARAYQWLVCGELLGIALAAASPKGPVAWLALLALGLMSIASLARGWIDLLALCAPASRLAFAPAGQMRLAGNGILMQTSPRSPKSGEAVLWYRHCRQRQDADGNWQMLADERSREPFLIDTPAGTCRIEPVDAIVLTSKLERWQQDDQRHSLWTLRPGHRIQAIGKLVRDNASALMHNASSGSFIISDLPDWRLRLPWAIWLIAHAGLIALILYAGAALQQSGRISLP